MKNVIFHIQSVKVIKFVKGKPSIVVNFLSISNCPSLP